MSTHHVFVYGSLLSGLHNSRIMRHSKFVATAHTKPEFVLYDLGAFPGMVHAGETSIRGEIYRVGEGTLSMLDQLEGHPNFYRRTEISVLPIGENAFVTAWAYVLPSVGARETKIESGSWREYRERRGA